jgi:hypothetical protein
VENIEAVRLSLPRLKAIIAQLQVKGHPDAATALDDLYGSIEVLYAAIDVTASPALNLVQAADDLVKTNSPTAAERLTTVLDKYNQRNQTYKLELFWRQVTHN